MVFVATGKTPGVYIDEIQLPGPIAGVGTSTAAFIGPARRGPASTPTFLTNWTEFLNSFGVTPAIDPTDTYGPYMVNPDVYVTHAVRGFFNNGGTACYFVRVTDAVAASLNLNDRATTPQVAFSVQAKDPGIYGNSIKVQVPADTPAVSTAAAWTTVHSITVTTANKGDTKVTVAPGDVANFNKNDLVFLADSTGTNTEFNSVSTTAPDGTINLKTALANTYTGGKIQKGNLIQSATGNTATVDTGDEQNFGTGDVVLVTDAHNHETATVASTTPGTITFVANLTNTYANGTIRLADLNSNLVEVPLVSASGTTVTVGSNADAAKFTANQSVTISDSNNTEQASVASVTNATITLKANLANSYTNGTISNSTQSSPTNTQSTLRVASVNNLLPGLPLTIKQGTTWESVAVLMVDRRRRILYLTRPLTHHYTLDPNNAVTIISQDFNLVISSGPTTETFNSLSMDPSQPNYYLAKVNSKFVDLVPPTNPLNTDPRPSNMPKQIPLTLLNPGTPESKDVTTFSASRYEDAIDTLLPLDDVNLVCVPDRTDLAVQLKIIEHCDTDTQDRFALLDPPAGLQPSDIKNVRANLSSDRGFGAVFYPRIQIPHPIISGTTLTVPPSGHLAGVFARVDGTEGVHKAPGNEVINGAVAIELPLEPSDMGSLNDQSINVIRTFKNRGVVVWGARTIAPPNLTQWRYLNIRRLLLFIEKSLQVGIQPAVFKPNNPSLWKQLKREITDFLSRVWNSGAFAGATAATSFSVRIDAELNPPDVMALGQLVIEVVVYPASPAEFIVIRMIQDPTGAALTES